MDHLDGSFQESSPISKGLNRIPSLSSQSNSDKKKKKKKGSLFSYSRKKPWEVVKGAFEKSLRPHPLEELRRVYGSSSKQSYGFLAEKRQLYVKIIAAKGVLALDTNNLSDPYCVVSVGTDSNTTRVEKKTLAPVWDETFVFDAACLQSAIDDRLPCLRLDLYDWDHFSADDFMGQVIIPFHDIEERDHLGWRSFPIKGVRKGKEEMHGTLELCIWFGDDEHQSGMNLQPQLGLLGAPKVLHHHTGDCMIEEPYFGILCLNVLEIHTGTGDAVSTQDGSENGRQAEFNQALKEKQVHDLFDIDGDEDEDAEDQDGDASPRGHGRIGNFGYVRSTLGSVTKTSHLVRQQGTRVPINDMLPFVVVLPILDREIRFVVYTTKKSKKRGRATHVAVVSMHDMLPQDLDDPEVDLRRVARRIEICLSPVVAGYQEARMLLSISLTDMDWRRSRSHMPHIPKPIDRGYVGLSADPRPMSRYQRATISLNEQEIFMLGKKTAGEFDDYHERAHRWDELQSRAGVFVKGAIKRQVDKGWNMMDWVLGKDTAEIQNTLASVQQNPVQVEHGHEELPKHLQIPESRGTFYLELSRIKIPSLSAVSTRIFAVIKFDQMWFRTRLHQPDSTGTVMINSFALNLPIYDPGSMVTMVIVRRDRKKESKEVTLGHFTVIGKLRFRVSSLSNNVSVLKDLPFLSQRSVGGCIVGHARFSLKVSYAEEKVRLKGYFPPAYPKENYVFRTTMIMKSLQEERRKLLYEWMSASNPPFPKEAIECIENIEVNAFQLSRLKTNLRRVRIAWGTITSAKKYYRLLASWKYPWLTRTACVFAFIFTHYPVPFISGFLIYLAYQCYTVRPKDLGIPENMEQDTVSIMEVDRTEEEEMVTGIKLEVDTANPVLKLKKKLDSVMGILLRVQTVCDGLASTMERFISLATWKDPLATTIIIIVLTVVAMLIFLVGPRILIAALLCFLIRPPTMRSPWTPGPISLFLKLPTRGERLA
ncbi:hypothetical protein M9434_003955 [Picochlorum sp. BPE23]|nr:hypothetical protein M9434_003955 [Picochlorum sp. BPE23]